MHCFLGGCLEDVFEGGEGFRQVLGQGGRGDFEVGEADLLEELFAARGGGG